MANQDSLIALELDSANQAVTTDKASKHEIPLLRKLSLYNECNQFMFSSLLASDVTLNSFYIYLL